jgi:hypothetical protein
LSTAASQVIAVSLVGAAASAVALQGWRSRVPHFDMVTTIDAAAALVEAGRIPDRGVISSFWSFVPPGAAWLMAPGLWIFDDPRLFDFIGSVSMFVGTVWGIFLLAQRHIGAIAALLSVVIYAFSQVGLAAASSLWQRYPIHCFTVWTVYFVVRWVEGNNHVMLAGAIVTLAAGLYVFLEMAPLALIIPIVWLLWRPVWRPVSAAAAVLVAFIVWLPYLQFEHERDFVDLSSQIERTRLYRADFNDSWCDPTLAPASWFEERSEAGDAAPTATIAVRQWLGERAGAIPSLIMANFRSASIVAGASLPLFLLTLVGLLAFAADAALAGKLGQRQLSPRRLVYVAIGSCVAALLFNERFLDWFLAADGDIDISSVRYIRALQTLLLTTAVTLVIFRRALATQINQLALRWGRSAHHGAPTVLAVCIAVPWAVLLLLSEAEQRFQWIWPLQAIALAASVTYVFRRLGTPRWLTTIAAAAVVILIAANPLLRSRVENWINDGWSGTDAIKIQVVDMIAERVGSMPPSIGYEIGLWRFVAMYNILDQRYKIGGEFDLLFKYRHRITNSNRCAEGVSSEDTYRVVQTDRDGENRLETGSEGGFVQVGRVGGYEILAREMPARATVDDHSQ